MVIFYCTVLWLFALQTDIVLKKPDKEPCKTLDSQYLFNKITIRVFFVQSMFWSVNK